MWADAGHVILRCAHICLVQMINVMKFLGRSGVSQLTDSSIIALQIAFRNILRRLEFTVRSIEIIRTSAWIFSVVTLEHNLWRRNLLDEARNIANCDSYYINMYKKQLTIATTFILTDSLDCILLH
jgi:hypothetical protein